MAESIFLKLHQNRIMQLLGLNGSTIKVYLAILNHADIHTGLCWPGYRTIGSMTGITSRKRIKEHIDILENLNMLERCDCDTDDKYRIIW